MPRSALNKYSLPIAFINITLSVVLVTGTVYAQNRNTSAVEGAASMGVARMVEIKDKNSKDGHIVSSSEKGAILSEISYDPQVLGVVSHDAAIILNSTGGTNSKPVIATGQVYVLVSTKEGPIQKGNLITTSIKPGIGVKAVKTGYVIGTALEDYTTSNPDQIGKIPVDLNLHYFNGKPIFPGSLTDILKLALLPTKESPTPVFKYLAAGGVTLASFILTFMTFGRTAAKGVEALGRNPAASRVIHLGIIFNVGICIIITGIGLTVAFLIMRL